MTLWPSSSVGLVVGDVALFLQNAGNLQLQLGGRNIHFLVPCVDRVANARQHVCDRIGQPHRLLLLMSPVRSAFTGGEPAATRFQALLVGRWSLLVSTMSLSCGD